MTNQKIKSDSVCNIGKNIRDLRNSLNLGQTELAIKLQLMGLSVTREKLVKIERGIQHIYATELKAIKEILNTSYDELLK